MKIPNKQISQVYSKSDSDSEEDALSEDALSEDSLSDSLSVLLALTAACKEFVAASLIKES